VALRPVATPASPRLTRLGKVENGDGPQARIHSSLPTEHPRPAGCKIAQLAGLLGRAQEGSGNSLGMLWKEGVGMPSCYDVKGSELRNWVMEGGEWCPVGAEFAQVRWQERAGLDLC